MSNHDAEFWEAVEEFLKELEEAYPKLIDLYRRKPTVKELAIKLARPPDVIVLLLQAISTRAPDRLMALDEIAIRANALSEG